MVGGPGVLQAVPAPAPPEDRHLQQPRRGDPAQQEALSHLQDWGPQGRQLHPRNTGKNTFASA